MVSIVWKPRMIDWTSGTAWAEKTQEENWNRHLEQASTSVGGKNDDQGPDNVKLNIWVNDEVQYYSSRKILISKIRR